MQVQHSPTMRSQADLGWAGCAAVERDPLGVCGAWVFRGSRIPVDALFENLEDGVSLAELIELFPGATQEQARLVLAQDSPGVRSHPGHACLDRNWRLRGTVDPVND